MDRHKHGERTRSSSRLAGKRKFDYGSSKHSGRKLDYEESEQLEEVGFGVLKIRPRPLGLKAKKARGDSRRGQPVLSQGRGGRGSRGGLMHDIIGDGSVADEYPRDVPRRAPPNNCFGGGTIVAGINIFRCNVQTALLELDGVAFNEEHYDLLLKTPFWFFSGL